MRIGTFTRKETDVNKYRASYEIRSPEDQILAFSAHEFQAVDHSGARSSARAHILRLNKEGKNSYRLTEVHYLRPDGIRIPILHTAQVLAALPE